MPFSDTEHGSGVKMTKKQWDHFYTAWIKRAVESYKKEKIVCKRSPAIPGNFIRGIVADLAESDIVIADITGSKANVFYELGIRHALKTGTVIITQDIVAVPSDLKSYYTFAYTYTDKTHEYEDAFSQFEKELHEKLYALSSGQVTSDGPVSDFLGFRAELVLNSIEKERNEVKNLLEECQVAFRNNFNVCEFLYTAFTEAKAIPLDELPIIDTLPLDVLFQKLMVSSWVYFPKNVGDTLRVLLGQHRKLMLTIKFRWENFQLIESEESYDYLIWLLGYVVNEDQKRFMELFPVLLQKLGEAGVVVTFSGGKNKKKIKINKRNKS